MSDIEKSFKFLHDNIPQWLQDITSIEDSVTAMQDEVVKVPMSLHPFPKRATESMESIRPDIVDAVERGAALLHGQQTEPAENRKRKTLSVLSGPGSGPSRYRSRTMIIVTYDGDMQKSFELLVRAIGTGRNMLRKAKMEAKMNELAALAGSSEDEDEADEDEDEAIMAKISHRPRMSSMRVRAAARSGGQLGGGGGGGASAPVALFDTTDKTLEHAQSLCEKAAHLTLRDGDCRKELEGVRKSFTDVLEIAKTEVTKCNAIRLQEPQIVRSQDSPDTTVSSAEPPYKRHFPQISMPPPKPQVEPKDTLPSIPTSTPPIAPKIMDIEVDDEEDDDDLDFVMPPVRLTSRFGA